MASRAGTPKCRWFELAYSAYWKELGERVFEGLVNLTFYDPTNEDYLSLAERSGALPAKSSKVPWSPATQGPLPRRLPCARGIRRSARDQGSDLGSGIPGILHGVPVQLHALGRVACGAGRLFRIHARSRPISTRRSDCPAMGPQGSLPVSTARCGIDLSTLDVIELLRDAGKIFRIRLGDEDQCTAATDFPQDLTIRA